LYTSEDAERVAQMRRGLEHGLSAAEAARSALADARPSAGWLEDAAARLLAAIREYDEATVQTVLDESFGAFGLEAVLGELVVPALVQIGREWEEGTLAVSQEHFASNLIRARLLAVARLWGRGSGPVALLACAPGELHDISLLAFGLVLRSHGWRIVFLGADTPITTVAEAAGSTQPAITILTSFDPARLEVEASRIRRLAKQTPLVLSGPGATEEIARRLRVPRLDGDLVTAALETDARFSDRP
jgi:methanogenic corrinoid protein MtbC1